MDLRLSDLRCLLNIQEERLTRQWDTEQEFNDSNVDDSVRYLLHAGKTKEKEYTINSSKYYNAIKIYNKIK